MSDPRLDERAVRFLAYLQRYRDDRGALAALRGTLSEARRQRAWPLLGGFQGAIGHPVYETVAALWAGDPASPATAGSNLGHTLRLLGSEHNTFEGRLKRLLTCDRDEIASRVVPVVRAAHAKGASVNYARLLSDLLWWNERTKVEWAKAFWEVPDEGASIAPELLDEAHAVATTPEGEP